MNIETINNLLKKALDEKDDSKLRIRVEIIHETIATLSKPLQGVQNSEMIQHSSFELERNTQALRASQGYIQSTDTPQHSQNTQQNPANTPISAPTGPDIPTPTGPDIPTPTGSERAAAFANLNLPPQPKRKRNKQSNEVSKTVSKGANGLANLK